MITTPLEYSSSVYNGCMDCPNERVKWWTLSCNGQAVANTHSKLVQSALLHGIFKCKKRVLLQIWDNHLHIVQNVVLCINLSQIPVLVHHQTTLRIVGSSGETMSVELLLQIVLSIANISSHYTHFSVVHVPYNNYTVFCHSRITTIMSSGWLTWISIIYCSSFIQFQSSQLFCPRASMASHHIGFSSVFQLPISDIYIYIYDLVSHILVLYIPSFLSI